MKSLVRSIFVRIGVLLILLAASISPAQRSSSSRVEFPLWKFDEAEQGCRAKGRLQDKYYCSSPIVDDVVARGKDSIPILISQLTDNRRTKKAVFDFWGYTTGGDIAFFLLTDLFTDSDWKTFNMPGVPGWATVHQHCNDASETCWRQYAMKHGRRTVQKQWMEAWGRNKDRIHWDGKNQCFRLLIAGSLATRASKAEERVQWQDVDQLCGQLQLETPEKKTIVVDGRTESRPYTRYLEGALVTLYAAAYSNKQCCATDPIATAHSRKYGRFKLRGVPPGYYWLRVQKTGLTRAIPVHLTSTFGEKSCSDSSVRRSFVVDGNPPKIEARIR